MKQVYIYFKEKKQMRPSKGAGRKDYVWKEKNYFPGLTERNT